ncbi:unnamed protein product [Clonostachys rosea]|uniref:Knr4/Smi1-like domain-containing protein n=1 Tax=Bionectria ochroleuca TaxID=29856 RepID=A0ABY6US50_BIOOC|nr:unnamed protein product [Clonostachys rosea]
MLLLIVGYFLWSHQLSLERQVDVFLNRPSSLPPTACEMKRMEEVADLVLGLYETLAEMRYIEPADIKRGPHDITHLGETVNSSYSHIDPAILYLYSILPYVEDTFSGHRYFFRGGFFLDFRKEAHRKLSRDPFKVIPNIKCDFDTNDGPYMRSWVTPLSVVGTRPISIFYDAREHVIWVVNLEQRRSADLALEGLEPWAFDHLPSRPAPDVLRDMKQWFREFKVVPDSLSSGELELEEKIKFLPALFRKHGWPDAFDGKAFQIERVRKNSARLAAWWAEEPLRELKRLREAKEEADRRWREQLNKVQDPSHEKDWPLMFALWSGEAKYLIDRAYEARELADQYCPEGVCQIRGDEPVWETETLRYIAEDWGADVVRLGASTPVDETALNVTLLKLAQTVDALEASRAAAKNRRPSGPVGEQLRYARRERNSSYRLDVLRSEKEEFSKLRSRFAYDPETSATTSEVIEKIQAEIDAYTEDEYKPPPSLRRGYTFRVDMDVFFDWEIEDGFYDWDMEDEYSHWAMEDCKPGPI